MSDLPRRLLFEDDGAHVLEYSLLIIGLGTALFEPFLLTAAYYAGCRPDAPADVAARHIFLAVVSSPTSFGYDWLVPSSRRRVSSSH